jgi:Tfp pilus assembly protein PilN
VKVARNVPLGLPKKDLPNDPESLQRFSQSLGKEISMTLTFFKQQFREAVPGTLYLVGNNQLQEIFEQHPLPGVAFDTKYGLAASPVQGMPENDVNENIHLIGNLYLSDAFNFLPQEELHARKTNVGFRIAYAALIVIFVLAGIWTLGLLAAQTDKKIEFKNKFSHLQNLQKQVTVLREDVSRLKPFEGWKQLYEDTFKNQPRWNMILSELALLVPSHLIIEGFQVVPEKQGQSPLWSSQISGKIRANNWQEGLSLLRQFGGNLQSSPFFQVTNLSYAPEEVQTDAKTFDFQVLFTIVSEEPAHEI